ncbi:MAG: hypothetical protein ACOY4R_25155 [Pseudomonadota bacterium]
MPNVRTRGKIAKGEWPKIAARFRNGETFTQIARSYGCTPPAIRYIVERASGGDDRRKLGREAQGKVAVLEPARPIRRSGRLTSADSQNNDNRGNFPAASPVREIWSRINIDIATFLAAMETLSADDSLEHYQNLLDATDRLLWGSARTRLELERLLSARKGPGRRRILG